MSLTVAVSGLHSGENPQPGPGIIRSLRRRYPEMRFVGLVYDVMESGIYANDCASSIFQMPLPSAGASALWNRWEYILSRQQVDIVIPGLDSEIAGYVVIEEKLRSRGVRTLLPTAEALRASRKAELASLAEKCQFHTPKTIPTADVSSALRAAYSLGYPLFVKGPFCGAYRVYTEAAMLERFHALLAVWGPPILLQPALVGGEFDVMAVGDGEGNIVAGCSIRKTIVSALGKGFGGITIEDAQLNELSERVVRELKWRGPLELEYIQQAETGEYFLIEINPRFPAWVDFPSSFGYNLPALIVEALQHNGFPSLPKCPTGKFFIRHSQDVLGDIRDLGELSTRGELHWS